MDRRNFNKLLLLGTAGVVTPVTAWSCETAPLKVQPLKPGSKIGLIAPADNITASTLEFAIDNMKALGLNYYHTPKVLSRHGSFGGTDEHRVGELHQMYRDSTIDAIWALGGGYGTTRLLHMIDYDLIRQNPKPLIGLSDITALLNTIQQRTGSPCFHGPNASSTITTSYTRKTIAPLFGLDGSFTIPLAPHNIDLGKSRSEYQYKVIKQGRASGRLVGGNLSLISAMAGTPYQVDTTGKLIFLEDIGEKPYRIDRMLTQLIDSGFFRSVTGVIMGVYRDCKNDSDDADSHSLYEVIKERMNTLDVPSVYGFSFGHIRDKCTFPINANATLDTAKRTVTLLESGF